MPSEFPSNKVLMIAPTPFFADRGCHVRVLNAYLRLKKQGDEVTLLTYPIGRDIEGVRTVRVIKLPGYNKTGIGFSIYRPILDLLLLIKAAILLCKGNYNYIYGHLHEGALIGILLRPLFNKKVVFDAQGSLTTEMQSHSGVKNNGIISAILKRIEKLITEKPDKIITSSHELEYFIKENFNLSCPITTIKDFPDTSIYNPNVEPASIDLPSGKYVAAYLGGLQPYKGIAYLLKAIPHVDPRCHFIIMGDPPDIWMDLVEELEIAERITFTGSVKYDEAPRYLKRAKIGLAPKTLESKETNGKIYQYAAMGLPTVCFDIPENREILKSVNAAGFFAEEKDVVDFARKVNEALFKI